MNKADREYMSAAARIGCMVCEILGYSDTPSELHHPRTAVGAGRRAPHSEVIPLCPEHHRGSTGLHGLGRKSFEKRYGVTEAELTERTKQRVRELLAMLV